MQDGSTIRNGYPLDLDNVSQGCRIGMMRCSDGTLHYYYNGSDQGVACGNIPPGAYTKGQLIKIFQHKIAIIFLSISLNMCFGCSNEPSH